MTTDARQYAPACERNREPILAQLHELLPSDARVLEVASGTGMHAASFAAALPGVVWQPSDPAPEALLSIRAWAEQAAAPGLLPPLLLDVCNKSHWPESTYNVLFCANMIHIAPWAACLALFEGAQNVITAGGALILYGPYRRAGFLEPSNEQFDASLRERNPEWGVRERDDVIAVADSHSFSLERDIPMPSNNRLLVFVRRA